jgi:ribosomal protein S18 acetylase RimI-like enzyme
VESNKKFEFLNAGHYTGGFLCGDPSLDAFLKHSALIHAVNGLSRTYVLATDADGVPNEVVAYLTLCAGSISKNVVNPRGKKTLPFEQLPALHIARLATHSHHQKQGHARILIAHAFTVALEVSNLIGIFGVHLQATNPTAIKLYEKLGFIRISDKDDYWISIGEVRQAVRGSA